MYNQYNRLLGVNIPVMSVKVSLISANFDTEGLKGNCQVDLLSSDDELLLSSDPSNPINCPPPWNIDRFISLNDVKTYPSSYLANGKDLIVSCRNVLLNIAKNLYE